MSGDDGLALDLRRAAEWIAGSDGLLICAGAGMGVDSGLPDFRGREGFWRAYPGLRAAGLDFTDIACPEAFREDPRRAWGFYGHRLELYLRTVPHEGFAILHRWAFDKPHGCFVFTSNVDGQFQKAGFEDARIEECHGSIHHLQCLENCCDAIWPANELTIEVDTAECRLLSPLPRCPHCGGLARPNILMFNDQGWLHWRRDNQRTRRQQWLAQAGTAIVVIELGAGTAIPTVRRFGEDLDLPLIRINPLRSPERPKVLVLPMGAVAALRELDDVLSA